MLRAAFTALGLLFASSQVVHAEPLVLTDEHAAELSKLMEEMEGTVEVRGRAERRYYELINDYVMTALDQLYNRSDIAIAYADFTKESERGTDGGTGLHIIKRIDDGPMTVLVNEHWPLEPLEEKISLPNELRVRIRLLRKTADKDRGKPNSHKDYISARYRIAWQFPDAPMLYIEPRYSVEGVRLQRRKSLLPTTCESCHHTGNRLRNTFVAEGVPIDYETNVQPHHFKPGFLPQSIGIQKLTAALGHESQIVQSFIKRAPYIANFPGQHTIFKFHKQVLPKFLPGDEVFNPSVFLATREPVELGTYAPRPQPGHPKVFFLEAIHFVEMEEFGRYDFWINPTRAIGEFRP